MQRSRTRALAVIAFGFVAVVVGVGLWSWQNSVVVVAQATSATPNVAVGPQYDTTHVYVPAADFDRFVASVLKTFGGTTSQEGVLR